MDYEKAERPHRAEGDGPVVYDMAREDSGDEAVVAGCELTEQQGARRWRCDGADDNTHKSNSTCVW